MKILKVSLIAILAILAISVAGVFGYLEFGIPAGDFDGECTALELDGSAEDIHIDRERGLAYLSLIDRLTLAQGGDAQGTIGLVDLNSPVISATSALISAPDHFRPHGISIYIDENGQRFMVVLNHPVNRGSEPEMVELFKEQSPGRYIHVKTYSDPLFESPNDLVAVGPEQFYIANDGGDGAKLVYFDGQQATVVANDINSGGGINASADYSELYVAETGGKALRVLSRNSDDGSVTTLNQIPLGTSPDNVDVAEDGSLWIGAHSDLLGLVMHFIIGSDAPSQVIRVELDDDDNGQIEEIYLNRGEEISASSVGATYGNKLLIGSITSRKILVCEMAGG
ncbi:MAG: hypothetical protein OEU86_09850 [Gammaproteobacteria bacterium]|nr:hypothetical protein [Gammaproteobacteria bacterium]